MERTGPRKGRVVIRKREDAQPARHYRLAHRTTYTYPEVVTSSYGRAVMLPRDGGGQQVHTSALHVSPTASQTGEHRDFHGNRSSYFMVDTEHTVLEVLAESVLTVTRKQAQVERMPMISWSQAAEVTHTLGAPGRGASGSHGIGGNAVIAVSESTLASEMVDVTEEVREFAAPSFGPGTPLAHVVAELCTRIHDELEYASGSTTVNTRLPEVLAQRKGVCQDFAHLLIACMRSMGLAARYVSGYIETNPPPGRPKLRGVDASHAWASVWLPGGGWLHVDPTNDQFVDNRYVVLGWGRDYRDVSPLRGIVFTEGRGSSLKVGVDLMELTGEELEEVRSSHAVPGPGRRRG